MRKNLHRIFPLIIFSIFASYFLEGCSRSQTHSLEETGIIILVDNSGSIGDAEDGSRTIETAKSWLSDINQQAHEYYVNDESLVGVDMGLVEFGGNCDIRERIGLGESKNNISTALASINPDNNLHASTAIIESVSKAVNLLEAKRNPKVILFTDLGENCQKEADNQCTLLQRIEDELSIKRVQLDLAIVGYSAGSISDTPWEECGLSNKWINVRYFDGGSSPQSLNKATQESVSFLEKDLSTNNSPRLPDETNTVSSAEPRENNIGTGEKCRFVIFCGDIKGDITIVLILGTSTFGAFALLSAYKSILQFLRNSTSTVLIALGNSLVVSGKQIKEAGQNIAKD